MKIITLYDIGDKIVKEMDDNIYAECECGNTFIESSTKIEKIGVVKEVVIKKSGICYAVRFKEGGSLYQFYQEDIKEKVNPKKDYKAMPYIKGFEPEEI